MRKIENLRGKLYIIVCVILILIIIAMLISFVIKNIKKDDSVPVNAASKEISELVIKIEKNVISVEQEAKIEVSSNAKDIVWTSSNPDIISVQDGVIKGITPGKSIIFAEINDIKSNEIEVECIIKLESITLNKTETQIQIGQAETLTTSVLPENATYKDILWSSSDANIATVQNGTITAINIGKCEIIAKDKFEEIETKCMVEVMPIEVTSVSLDDSNVSLGKGEQYLLLSSLAPTNATYKDLTWSSNNNNIVTVDNGKIKAVGTGSAVVSIIAHNGKSASCTFTVTEAPPTREVKYSKGTYNIRNGPSSNYGQISSVNKNDEIQLFKINNGWAKVKTPNGTVGFIISSGYTSNKSYYINNVPYLNQFSLGYPTGCEAVSATMAAKHAGYNISAASVIEKTPTDSRGIWTETIEVQVGMVKANKVSQILLADVENDVIDNTANNTVNNTVDNSTINNTTGNETNNNVVDNNTTDNTVTPDPKPVIQTKQVTYGGNPFKVFVGHPSKKLGEGSYGCFAEPIVTALTSLGVPCTNISNCSQDTLLNYIRQGKPVIVWCVKNAGDLVKEETWQYPDGSGSFTKLKGEHCAVLIGYDDEYVYLHDPSAGKDVKQPRGKFFSNWNALYKQAIIIN